MSQLWKFAPDRREEYPPRSSPGPFPVGSDLGRVRRCHFFSILGNGLVTGTECCPPHEVGPAGGEGIGIAQARLSGDVWPGENTVRAATPHWATATRDYWRQAPGRAASRLAKCRRRPIRGTSAPSLSPDSPTRSSSCASDREVERDRPGPLPAPSSTLGQADRARDALLHRAAHRPPRVQSRTRGRRPPNP